MDSDQELPDTQYSGSSERGVEDVHYQVDETESSGATILLGPLDGRNDDATSNRLSQSPKPLSVPLNDTVPNTNSNFKASLGSFKSASTQPFSQQFFDEAMDPQNFPGALGTRDDGAREDDNEDTTEDTQIMSIKSIRVTEFATGGEDSDVDDLGEIEDSDDDLDMRASQLVSQFPEEKRFQLPKTPASRGKKRFRNGAIVPGSEHGSASASTPKLPVNPFAQRGPTDPKIMSLSQVFNATQAPSSPMLNVPTSDGIFDRPSPTLGNETTPDVHPDSSPAKLMRPAIKRNLTEPHGRHVSMKGSKIERDGIRTSPLMTSEPHYDSDHLLDDEASPGSSGEGHHRKRQERARARGATRATASANIITPQAKTPSSGIMRKGLGVVHSGDVATTSERDAQRRRRQRQRAGSFDGERSVLETSHNDTSNVLTILSEVDSQGEDFVAASDIDSDATQRQTSHSPKADVYHDDNVGTLGKENVPDDPIQVPRTVSKKTRNRHIHVGLPQIEEGGLSPYRTESQLVAVANSQPTEATGLPSTVAEVPMNGADAQNSSRVPDSTEAAAGGENKATEAEVRVGSNPSQQTATPPSSSPSPQKHISAENGNQRMPSDTAMDPASHRPPEDELTSPSTPRPQRPRTSRDKIPDTVDDRSSLYTRTPILRETGSKDRLATVSEKGSNRRTMLPHPRTSSQDSLAQRSGTTRAQDTAQHVKPRKFADIVPDQSPLSQGLEFDISALSREDQEFNDRMEMGQLPSSSPVRPAGRRRIKPLEPARRIPLSNSQDSSLTPPLPASSDATGEVRAPPSSLSQARGERPDTSQRNTLSQSQDSNSSEKENISGAHRKRPVVSSSIESDYASSRQLSQETEPLSDVEDCAGGQNDYGLRNKRPKPNAANRNPYTPAQSDGTGLATEPSRQSSEPPFAPTRVWALFNGTPAGFFPAECLGITEPSRLRVRFDDGKEDVVPSSSVRRLEIRIGDVIKVDDGEARKSNTFTVEALEHNLREESQPGQRPVGTDVNGWSRVKIALKQKDGSSAAQRDPVPVSCLYLTKTLFNRLRDRDFDQSSLTLEGPHEMTPSSCHSVLDTPASRRRVRTSVKKEGSFRRSFKSSMGKTGLFSGMAFAMTAVNKDKRSELESSIVSQGGMMLASGLESLFNVPEKRLTQSSDEGSDACLSLDQDLQSTGFTALLADKHGRTTNYLYALALNVPCVSPCWVRDCIAQSRILDWRHYLLPSGEVQMLEGTVVSRIMEIPQEFSTSANSVYWPIESMFQSRRKPLWQQNILLISSKSKGKGDDHQAWVFIFYALGAEMVCVAPGEKEAEDHLQSGTTWGWVCLTEDESEVGRRRSRKPDLGIKWRNGVRMIKKEFVVQSLLLGRLIEE